LFALSVYILSQVRDVVDLGCYYPHLKTLKTFRKHPKGLNGEEFDNRLASHNMAAFAVYVIVPSG